MTQPASVGTVSVEPVPVERAALRAETAPAFRRRARAGRVSGAHIDLEAWPTRLFFGLADALGRYHRHQVVNLGRLRRLLRSDRPVLLVGNHALDIVDPLLLLATIFRKLHRVPRFIGHQNGWFNVPVLREISARFDRVVANRTRYTDALNRSIRDAERLLERIGL